MFHTPIQLRPRLAPGHSRRGAFTLTEVLVVITIVVLVLAMSVPLFNIFSASRSVDGAENLVSASLQRARARAIGMQERRGLFFFADPVTGTVGMVTVVMINSTNGSPPSIDLELDADGLPVADVEPLPSGVGAAFLGRNAANSALEWRPLGLILFDGFGRIEQVDYIIDKSSSLAQRTGLSGLTIAIPLQSSQVALQLYEKRGFVDGAGSTSEPNQTLVFDAPQAAWLNLNGTAIVMNRYNGTVFRGQ